MPNQKIVEDHNLAQVLDRPPSLTEDRDSLLLYRNVIESSSDLISIVDPDYVYRHVNPAYLAAHGLPMEQILGRPVAELLGEEQFEHVARPHLDRCLAGEQVTYESWFDFRVAGRRFMYVTYAPLRSTSDQVDGIVVTSRDMTPLWEAHERLRSDNARLEERVAARTRQLQEANDALRVNEERFRALYENSPSMYFIVDQQGLVQSVNQIGSQHLGYAREELIGRPVMDVFHPEDRTLVRQALAHAFSHPEQHHQWQFRKWTKSGETLWAQKTARAIQEPNGSWVGLIVCQDITAQIRSEQLLRQSEQFVRSLQQATSTPGVPFDERIQAVLELGCRRLGFPIGICARMEEGQAHISHAWPPSAPIQAGTRLPLCDTYCSIALEMDGPLHIPDTREPAWCSLPAFSALPFRSYLGTKLACKHITYGTICFVGSEPSTEQISESQAEFLALMARWISDELDRQSSEQALLESRELFVLAFRASPHPVMISELATGRCIEVNDVSLELFGYARHEVLGRNTIELGIWSSVAEREQFLARLQQDGRLQENDMRLRTKDGRWLHCRISASLITLRGVRCVLTVGHDVTEQRRTELALRQSEERFRRLFEDSPVGMCLLSQDGTIAKINPAFQSLVGYQEQEILGHAYVRFIHPDDLPLTETLTHQFSNGQSCGYTIETRYIRNNGARIWVSVTLSLLSWPGITTRMGVAVVRDITARKLAEQALEQRERDLRQALQEREQVSQDLHDGILQSLYAVGLSLDATGRLVGDAPRRAKKELTGAISQLNRTIQEVRSFITGLSFDSFDVPRLTQALQSVVAPFCKAGRTRCDIAVSPVVMQRLTRPVCAQLVNIVREAVSNSVRHGHATRIRISLRLLRGRVQLAIRDNGRGFNPDSMKKRGYGLRNMRSRAGKVGGTLGITSTADSGTRIVVHFGGETPS